MIPVRNQNAMNAAWTTFTLTGTLLSDWPTTAGPIITASVIANPSNTGRFVSESLGRKQKSARTVCGATLNPSRFPNQQTIIAFLPIRIEAATRK